MVFQLLNVRGYGAYKETFLIPYLSYQNILKFENKNKLNLKMSSSQNTSRVNSCS